MKFVGFCLCSLLFSALAVSAADRLTGNWVAELTTQGEKHVITFDLKASGGKVTGTEGRSNAIDVEIQNGSCTSDSITFTVTRNIGDRTLVLDYSGKISDGKIEFTVKPRGNGWTTNLIAIRRK